MKKLLCILIFTIILTVPFFLKGATIVFFGGTDDGTAATVSTGATDNEKVPTQGYVDDAIPVKATGAELTTGTDDAKFATAKAIKDSHNVPSVAPGADGNVLTSDGTGWVSEEPSGDSYPSASSFAAIECDFIAMGSSTADRGTFSPWNIAPRQLGTIVKVAGTLHHPGIVEFHCPATNVSGLGITTTLSNDNGLLISGTETTEFVFKVPVTANTAIRLGFQDKYYSAAVVNGAYVYISTTTVSGICTGSSSSTATSSDYTLTQDTWYRAKVVVNSDATQVDFFLYSEAGSELWTDNVTTNIPTTAGQETAHGAVAWTTTTTAHTLMYLDYMNLYMTRALTR